jgi:hypothetical protein
MAKKQVFFALCGLKIRRFHANDDIGKNINNINWLAYLWGVRDFSSGPNGD